MSPSPLYSNLHRFVGIRPDKSPEDASDPDYIADLFNKQTRKWDPQQAAKNGAARPRPPAQQAARQAAERFDEGEEEGGRKRGALEGEEEDEGAGEEREEGAADSSESELSDDGLDA